MAASHGWLASLPNQLAVASSVVNHRSAAAASFIVRASSTDASLTEKGMLGLAFRCITTVLDFLEGRYYTLVVGANERRWTRLRNKLKVVADSFKILDI
ncbi:hypothetical protein BHE74_00022144 [Ensete ventricosum]|nr:hypothetical protein BHE74_00022144 [Ensete ventricosum]